MSDNRNKGRAKHIFCVDLESAKGVFDFTVTANSLLLDLKVLLSEYYLATFNLEGDALILRFTNGQIFRITMKEITPYGRIRSTK